ncbi:D-arabinose 5-phosphate isomerase, partial [Pseudomonas syringae]
MPRGSQLRDALLEMTRRGLGMAAIVEADGTLAGIFTGGDLRRTLDRPVEIRQTLIDEVITLQRQTAPAAILPPAAPQILAVNDTTPLVVVEPTDPPVVAFNP